MLSSGCSSWREIIPVEVKTVEVDREIPTQGRPKPIKMSDIHFYVVSVRDYETLALNMAELKRYIQQQNEIIIYYEEAVKPIKKEDANGKVQRKN